MAVAATGFFDGVHLGHRRVISTLVETARQRSDKSVVVTFWPHPRIVLGNEPENLAILTPLDKKIEIIKRLGVDEVHVLEFTPELSRMTACEYIRDILRDRYGADLIVLGYDSRLGHDRQNPEMITMTASALGVGVIVTPPVRDDSKAISSTRIRKLVAEGKISEANELLGYDYY